MKKWLFLASALTTLTFSAAQAADAVVYETIPEMASAAFNWTGAYVGAQVGYGSGSQDISFPTSSNLNADRDPDGFLGGVYVGYNYQIHNNIVFSAEADIAYARLRDNGPIIDNGVPNAVEDWHANVDWTGSVRARVGYAMDRTLIYFSGGAAFARFSTAVYDSGTLRGESSKTRTGWTIGAGIEHAFTDNLVGRLDYRYADFGSVHYDTDGIPGTIPTDVNLTSHDIRIGIAYKF